MLSQYTKVAPITTGENYRTYSRDLDTNQGDRLFVLVVARATNINMGKLRSDYFYRRTRGIGIIEGSM